MTQRTLNKRCSSLSYLRVRYVLTLLSTSIYHYYRSCRYPSITQLTMPVTTKTTLRLLTDLGVLLGTAAATGAYPHGGADGPHVAAPGRLLSSSCTNIMHCKDGDAFTDASFQTGKNTTCEPECDGQCCQGKNACNTVRFSVCADDGNGGCNENAGESEVCR